MRLAKAERWSLSISGGGFRPADCCQAGGFPRSMKINIVALLGVLFIGLKLTGHIDWSWLLVLLPFYWPLLMVLICLPGLIVAAACESKNVRGKR